MRAKISVLMNCFNGEKYLKEAIDSVFNQTLEDWEIIFIDNCSTDKSASIAKSYGKKVKYFSTEKNIPLGAARKFGVEFCSEYIATLDTDDIWLPHALENLYEAITSGDFALAYGHQYLIDKNGSNIGEIKNIYARQKGNLFSKLLVQFDIPMVATMISKVKMLKSKLNFDENVYGSVEYALFIPLAVKNNYIALDTFIVKYRVHDSLSTKLSDKLYKERINTLNKILKQYPDLKTKHPNEFREAFARGAYYKSQHLMSKGEQIKAFKTLNKYMFIDVRYFLLTLLTICPIFIWNFVQKMKNKKFRALFHNILTIKYKLL
jgi:glycosyltransferase involved in cell wall biosynthesis